MPKLKRLLKNNRMFLKVFLAIMMVMISTNTYAKHNHNERYYQEKYCLNNLEYRLPDKSRVDCLTDEYAIEFEFVNKWKESVGQALYYSIQTGKKPAIYAIMDTGMTDKTNKNHLKRLSAVCEKYDIKLFVIE